MTVWLRNKNNGFDKVEYNVEAVYARGEYIHISYYKADTSIAGTSYSKDEMEITRIDVDR